VRELDLTGFGDLPGLVEITDALREFDCGVWEGESSRAHGDDYGRLFRDWQAGKWDSRIGGGESLLDVQARFLPFIEHLKLTIGGLTTSCWSVMAELCSAPCRLYSGTLTTLLRTRITSATRMSSSQRHGLKGGCAFPGVESHFDHRPLTAARGHPSSVRQGGHW